MERASDGEADLVLNAKWPLLAHETRCAWFPAEPTSLIEVATGIQDVVVMEHE